MIAGVDPRVGVALVVVLVVGATIQSTVGLGLGLVSAPLVTLLAPSLMPQLMLVLAALLPLVTLVRDHEGIDWRGLAWVLPARAPGTAVGVVLLALLPDRGVGVAVALMVLLAVALSVRSVRVPVTPATLVGAGLVSGATGTATSIGGPPVALLYQHRPPAQIRTTLAVFFTVGAAMSLVGIGVGGRLEPHTLLLALALSPALPVGAWLGARLRRLLPEDRVRPVVLLVCAASALVLLARSLL